MKVIVTTSNTYINHVLPVFCFLFNKYWGDKQQVEVVGYDQPNFHLPTNFNFISLGIQQGGPQNFTKDLRKYFAKQDKFFIWMMEDCFLRQPINFKSLNLLKSLTDEQDIQIGRINLSREVMNQDHSLFKEMNGVEVFKNNKYSLYRLSTQASIWNKHFALQYMVEDLSPWEFECQSDHANDEFIILGLNTLDAPVTNNEGVRKRNIYSFDLNGIPEEYINEMKQLNILQ